MGFYLCSFLFEEKKSSWNDFSLAGKLILTPAGVIPFGSAMLSRNSLFVYLFFFFEKEY